MADGDGVTDVIDLSGNGKGVALNVWPFGIELPIGGTTGQVLAKNSDANYDFEWIANGSTAFSGLTGNPRDNAPLDAELDALTETHNTYVDELFATINQTPVPNGLVSGGQVAWESGLTFRVSAAIYYIGGTRYATSEQTITLDAAHATLDRIDVIAVNSAGNVEKITGVAATTTPSEPDVDPTTQLKLTFVIVGATDTEPAGITVENIYLENTEWTMSVGGVGFNINSTNNPQSGTKCIEFTSAADKSFALGQSGVTLDAVNFSLLRLHIRSKAAWAANRVLRINFLLNGVVRSTAITVASGYWGFDSSNISNYQFVGIPMSQFLFTAGTTFNQIRIMDIGGAIGGYIDNVSLQGGTTTIGTPIPTYLTQDAADARYVLISTYTTGLAGKLAIASNLSDLNNVVTARANLGLTIGTHVQAFSSVLLTYAGINPSANIQSILGAANYAAVRTLLGLTVGTDIPARSPTIQSVGSAATVTPTFADDQVNITAQAAALALANPTGTAVPAWGIVIRIKDNGTARAISWDTQYRAIGVTLPTTTVINKTLYIGMIYNSTDTKWDVVAVAQEA